MREEPCAPRRRPGRAITPLRGSLLRTSQSRNMFGQVSSFLPSGTHTTVNERTCICPSLLGCLGRKDDPYDVVSWSPVHMVTLASANKLPTSVPSVPSAVRVARPALLPAVPKPLLLLVSWLYGPAQWNSTCLPLFLRSVGASPTIRVAIVGDPSPPAHLLPMPSNVEFISLPWGTLCARLQTVLSASMHHVNGFDYRKITDMKPLAALLVPEVITPYAWWGWIDNDVRPARRPARVPYIPF